MICGKGKTTVVLKTLAIVTMVNYRLAMSEKIMLLARMLGQELRHSNLKVTCAESCTGGRIASAITEISGSSQWFEYGFVTYADAAKQQLLGVSGQTVAAEGAVSEAVVKEMAQGALQSARADVAVAVSGIAGPEGGTADKPVGTVWFCWCRSDGHCITQRECFSGDRTTVRTTAVEKSLQGVLDILKK